MMVRSLDGHAGTLSFCRAITAGSRAHMPAATTAAAAAAAVKAAAANAAAKAAAEVLQKSHSCCISSAPQGVLQFQACTIFLAAGDAVHRGGPQTEFSLRIQQDQISLWRAAWVSHDGMGPKLVWV